MAIQVSFSASEAIRVLLQQRPELAAKMGWEQAHDLGVSDAEWSHLKRGTRSGLTFRVLAALCRGFGVDLPTFLRLGGMPEAEVVALLPYLRADSPAQPVKAAHNLTITKRPSVTYPKKAAKKRRTVKVTQQLKCDQRVPTTLDSLFSSKLPYTPLFEEELIAVR